MCILFSTLMCTPHKIYNERITVSHLDGLTDEPLSLKALAYNLRRIEVMDSLL